MVKKIITSSLFLAAGTGLAGVVLLNSFHQLPSIRVVLDTEHLNKTSIALLQSRLPEALAVSSDEKTETLKGKALKIFSSAKPARLEPKNLGSIISYFYYQTSSTNPLAAYNSQSSIVGLGFSEDKIGEYVKKLDAEISRESKNAKLIMEGGRAVEFVPDEVGVNLDVAKSVGTLKLALVSKNKDNITLAIHETVPTIRLAEINDLGIKEMIGQGVSDFNGSTRSRIHNIKVGAEKYRGLILRAGEEFSFNKHLGAVTAQTGYLPELVIKAEGTVPEFGGGLCQVSSTAFRAAFFGGMPITERKNHSYAVNYYRWINDEIPASEGLDATIYPGVVDMKFTNDTPGAILVWTYIDKNKLYFDFYGTRDNRQVVVDGPHTYDRQTSGALKANVSRTVTKSGKATEQQFYSNYVSPDRYPRTYEYAENPSAPQNEDEGHG